MAKRSAKSRALEQQKRNEVRGVVLIALGVFVAVCQYFDAIGIIGQITSETLFGLTGLFAHGLPFVLLIAGLWYIISVPKSITGRVALIVLGVFFIIALLHVGSRNALEDVSFIDYVKNAYKFGVLEAVGGGAAGAIMCYPLLILIGKPGAYIFLVTALIIIVLLVTGLSLRETGKQVKTKVQEGLHYANEKKAARRQLYIEQLENPKRESPRSKQGARPDVTMLPADGPIKLAKQSMRAKDEPPWSDDEYDNAPDVPEITYYDDKPKTVRELKTDNKEKEQTFSAIPLFPKEKEAESVPSFDELCGTDPDLPRPPYVPPSFSLLNPPRSTYMRATMEAPTEKAKLLIDTLESFHVQARVVNISVGPVVTRFELAPAPGVRVNKITALSDDIALALAAPRVRIEAPIPGKSAVGIEVPNKDTAMVVLRDIIESDEFEQAASPITIALGKDIAGKIIVADLAKMPHLLIAGATGSGKSVCINDIIVSLVYKCTPDELQLILVDPKVVELSVFGVLPHLKLPVVTDPKKAASALAGGVREMSERYKKFAQLGARDLARFNELQKDPADKLPKLVIVIDELADLMMVAPDAVEDNICRIAQLGRAAGIHLIVATQRPSADVITGLIKANVPSRIAFSVASAIDSRIILDAGGAEKLIGRGDMLFHPNGASKPIRVQGAYVCDEEVERVVRHFEQQQLQPEFDESMLDDIDTSQSGEAKDNGQHDDELLGEAVRIVLDSGQASISMIQRRLRVGYARAARLVDIMEQRGYVSGFDGSKPRKLLITGAQYASIFGQAVEEAEDE